MDREKKKKNYFEKLQCWFTKTFPSNNVNLSYVTTTKNVLLYSKSKSPLIICLASASIVLFATCFHDGLSLKDKQWSWCSLLGGSFLLSS